MHSYLTSMFWLMYNHVHKKFGVIGMNIDESSKNSVTEIFTEMVGEFYPDIDKDIKENLAKNISAVHIHSYHDEERGMLHDIRAICDFGNGYENINVLCDVENLYETYQSASVLASYNEDLRIISGSPYLVADPNIIEEIEAKEDGAYFSFGNEGAKFVIRAHIPENQLPQILETWRNPNKDFKKVVVHEGNLAKAQFGQKHYDKGAGERASPAEVIPLNVPER